jgi:hypothetical protein
MSAGTSGILPSATYAACDGANSVVGKEPLWLSTAGGNVFGNLSITGNEVVSGALTAAAINGAFAGMLVPGSVGGQSGIQAITSIVIGRTRICWGSTGIFNAESKTISLFFTDVAAGVLPQQSGTGVYNKPGGQGIQFAIAIAQNGLSTGGITGCFPNQAPSGTPSLGNVTFQEANGDAVSALFFVVGEWEGAP